jgi:hypothetical protein
MMNGTGEHVEQGAPIVTINQINLTGKQIVSIGSMLIGAIMSAYAAGWLFLPAKKEEFEALNKVVQVMQVQLTESREAINRLTSAVETMGSAIRDMKNTATVPLPRAKNR